MFNPTKDINIDAHKNNVNFFTFLPPSIVEKIIK